MITFKKLGRFGRFGNQFFQYAGTRLYAHLNNYEFTAPSWIGCEIFHDIKSYTFFEYLKSRLLQTQTLIDHKAINRREKLLSLIGVKSKRVSLERLYTQPQDNINLHGFLQEPYAIDQLKKHRPMIQEWFIFKKEIETAFSRATENYRPWIGVHIRHGDFVKRGLTVPTNLYSDWLRQFRKSGSIFVISDNPKIRDEMTEFNPITPVNPLPAIPNFIFDFWLLCRSQTVLGCGSTFSWWAAFLNKEARYFSPPLTHLRGEKWEPKLEEINL